MSARSDTGPFAIVPEWLLDADVSDRAIRLYCLLGRYADKSDGTCWPSRALLAERLRCHMGTLDRARTELIEAGALLAEQRWTEPEHGRKAEQLPTLYTVLRVPTRTATRAPRVRARE